MHGSSPLERLLDASIVLSFDRTGFRRHARRFTPLDVRLAGKVAVVTGASSGIGLATAAGLAALGASVRMVCRDEARGRAAVEAVRAATPGADLRLDLLDVSDLDALRGYARSLADPVVDVLVHNAGVLLPARGLTAQGLERTFATHVAGPWLLTHLLADRLRRPGGRVIFVSSGGMYTARLSLADLGWAQRPWDGVAAYAQTKRMQVVAAELLAARLGPGGLQVHSMHPGWADTPAVRTALPHFWRLTRRILRTPAQGADTVVWLSAAEPPPPSGFWFDRGLRSTHLAPWTRESAAEREGLRALLDSLRGAPPGPRAAAASAGGACPPTA